MQTIELKEFNQSFNEQDLLESDFVSSGSEATITRYGLINGQYHWRARAFDSRGATSDWQEFGTQGNIDFEVKLVPLYTQIISPYPSDVLTAQWANMDYAEGAAGNYNCGSKIYQCGCVITSIVMIARYYDVLETQGKDVNPGEINQWLKDEPGGYINGDVNWIAGAKYTNWRIKYEKSEIPEAWYFEDGFDDPTGENPPSPERNKLIQILEPIDGEYQLQVIGTGEGIYSLQSTFYDNQGISQSQKFQSETAPGYVAQYNISFDSSNSANTMIELFDEIPPEAEIFFNSNTQRLEVKGIDNTTVHPTVSVIEQEDDEIIYQIQDEAGNTIKLYFEKLKQEGKEIKAELEGIQYDNNPIIKTEAELKYEWSLTKDGNIKELEQKIEVEGRFDIKAKYNHQRNETKIKIKEEDKEEIRQTLPRLVIVKLVTKLGVLDFDF